MHSCIMCFRTGTNPGDWHYPTSRQIVHPAVSVVIKCRVPGNQAGKLTIYWNCWIFFTGSSHSIIDLICIYKQAYSLCSASLYISSYVSLMLYNIILDHSNIKVSADCMQILNILTSICYSVVQLPNSQIWKYFVLRSIYWHNTNIGHEN